MSPVFLCSAWENRVMRTNARTELPIICWPFQAPFWTWSKDGITQRERDQGTWSQVLSPSVLLDFLASPFHKVQTPLINADLQKLLKTICFYALSSCKADPHQSIKTPLLIFSTKPTPHIAKSLQEPLQFPKKLEIMITRFFRKQQKKVK